MVAQIHEPINKKLTRKYWWEFLSIKEAGLRGDEVIELQYHSEQNIVFLFKCYWYDSTTNREIRVDPHYGLIEINSKARHRNENDVFVFAKQCQQVYYTYTPSFRKDRSRVDWLSILKTKPEGHVEVV
jgi:hypothetical protein